MDVKNMWVGADGGDAEVTGNNSTAHGGDAGDSATASGGTGGSAFVKGNNSHAVGGRGGRGGIGPGSPGGTASVEGDNQGAYGGEGGEASQADGRGGRGGAAQGVEFFGLCPRRARMKMPYGEPIIFPGRGGDAPDTVQYMARRLLVEDLKQRYFIENGLDKTDSHHVWYDRTEVPLEWINEQLLICDHSWQVNVIADEYAFSDIEPRLQKPSQCNLIKRVLHLVRWELRIQSRTVVNASKKSK